MMLWHFGNTSVRSPFRLRDGLIVIYEAGLEGRLRGGQEYELALCKALDDYGVVNLQGDVTYSVGRKWRSALEKMGFIVPKLDKEYESCQNEIGAFDYISENGLRLIEAESVAAWQECFLRSLAAYSIPSIVEDRYSCEPFSPLRHTLKVMLELENQTGDNKLSIQEMGFFVQCSSSNDNFEELITSILKYREEKELSQNKKKYYQEFADGMARLHGKAAATFRDYADTNFRYLKATGLVQSKGQGIAFVPEKRSLIEKLIVDYSPKDGIEYVKDITRGAELPTDKKSEAEQVLQDLIQILSSYGYEYDLADKSLGSAADINVVRHEVEELIFQYKEIDFAGKQVELTEEIEGYIDLLLDRKKRSLKLSNGEEIKIPNSDAPAYFEWVIWRLFLAINYLKNKPWEARRFKIDQDFLPVNCAPGNGPDLIFEYDDMVLVVEVTLTTSSRQEAAEGEPVRRHVAQYAEKYADTSKRVYGLFIAVSIDTNTANTFRLGEWYLKDDSKINLHIVPISLQLFKSFIINNLSDSKELLSKIKFLLMECRMHATLDAPTWKKEIDKICIEGAK